MILLTLYNEPEGIKENRVFAFMHEAIEFGQKTGSYYDLYDQATGKVTDWNEINVRDEDDWYYDEVECLWKKLRPEDGFYNGIVPGENQFCLMDFPVAGGAVC